MISPTLALSIACRTSAAAVCVSFVEQYVVFDRLFGPEGPSSSAVAEAMGASVLPGLFSTAHFRYVFAVGCLAAAVLSVTGPYSRLGTGALVVVVACVLLNRIRRITGGDGAEQMATLTLFATCAVVLQDSRGSLALLAVWFVGGQSLLSYLTAGLAKATSHTWRSGEAIPLIMGSEAYGQPWAANALAAFPDLGKYGTRFTMAFECAFPLIVVAPKTVVFAVLAIGIAFHLGCAVTMGLNAFLLVFPGSYVCVAYIAERTSPLW